MTDPTPLPEVPRWHLCRQCGMVRDIRGQAHSEYGRYEEQGPYFIREADHLTAMRAQERQLRDDYVQARDTALREALRTVKDCRTGFRLSIGASPEPPERYWLPKDDALAAIQRLIDGGDTP